MSEQDSNEIWKPIANHPGREVSSLGRVRRVSIMKTGCNDAGYPCVRLSNKGGPKRVHRLVAEAFIGPIPAGMEVNHKNGIRHDARVENLEIISHQENVTHSIEVLGNTNKPPVHIGERAHFAKLTAEIVRQIRELHGKVPGPEVAERFAVSFVSVYNIWNRKSWKHI